MNILPTLTDFGIIGFHLFLVGSIINILSPGPASLIVVTNTMENGRSDGIKTALGIISGNFLSLLSVSIGIGLLFNTFPWLNKLLLYFGSGFLIWLGFGSIKKGWGSWSENKIKHTKTTLSSTQLTPSAQHPFIQGFLVAIMNPLAFFFYIAFIPQFIDINFTKPHLTFSVLSIFSLTIQIQYLLALVLLGYILATRPTMAHWLKLHHHWVSSLEIGIGLIFIAYGCSLFLS